MFMHLNQGRFRQNGGCGYILKPEIMRRANPGARLQSFDVNMKDPHPLVPVCNFEIEVSIIVAEVLDLLVFMYAATFWTEFGTIGEEIYYFLCAYLPLWYT